MSENKDNLESEIISETETIAVPEVISESEVAANADKVITDVPATIEVSEETTEISENVVTVETKADEKIAKADAKRTTIGGQALIEGIMMCGPKRTAIAVRKGDGSIHIEEVKQSDRVSYFEKVPFIRGCIKFYKMLVTGTDATMKSAEISEQGKEDTDPTPKKESKLDSFLGKHHNVMLTLSSILGIALSVGLFILLPRLVVDLVSKLIDDNIIDSFGIQMARNCIEGVLRIVIFLVYLLLVSKLPDIARVWQYHGAEHKTIACYEARLPLTVENIMKQSRFHPRCGTAFMFIVLMISILIYTIVGVFVGDSRIWVNILMRVVLIPIICGISYEILRFVGRYCDHGICKILVKPGLWLQRFTTKEPDPKICEVAIAAMQAVIPENDNDDNW